jgi:Haloacid Dehalogenase superfamily, subfamily IB, phosphoserine phosphatase-like/2,3-diketo-5-methylthio-1-phosphopentane phosphatase
LDRNLQNNISIICDFDGTVSVEDVNSELFKHYGNEKSKSILYKYRGSEIGLRQLLQMEYENLGIDDATFESFVINNISIDETFFSFCDFVRERGIDIAIVSGGFLNYIQLLYKKYKRKLDIPVFANKLVLKNGIMVPEYGQVPECITSFGPCGICKYRKVMEYKKKGKVIYIGDGLTDRCAAEYADIVFAKSTLSKYCMENKISYIGYSNFDDVKAYILKSMDRL